MSKLAEVVFLLYFLIAIGGFFGALLRVMMAGLFPLGTFMVNLTGSFLMCLFMTLTLEIIVIKNDFKVAIATGLLGSYTTFSLFSLESYGLLTSGHFVLGTLYFVGTPLSCVALGYLGLITGKAFVKRYQIKSGESNTDI